VEELTDGVICNNGVLDIPITTTIPSTISWSAMANNSVSGETTTAQASTSISDSLTNNTSNPQFVTYTITPTSVPFGCVGPDSLFTIQVQPNVVLSIPTTLEICSGSPVNAQLAANIPSNFNWFVSFDNPNVIGESIQTNTNAVITDVLTNNTTTNQIVVYAVTPVSTLGNCVGQTQTIAVTVKPPLALLNEDTLTICSGTNVNLNLVANTNVSFNWYADPSVAVLNETTNLVSNAFINDNLVNTSNTVQQVNYYAIGTSTANGCSSPIIPIVVYVNPTPSVLPVMDSIVCNASNFNAIQFTGPVSNTNFAWSTTGSSIGFSSTNGNNSIPGFTATNNTVNMLSSSVQVTPTYTNNALTCAGTSSSFSLAVLPTPSVFELVDVSICAGTLVPQNNLNGPVSSTTYTWSNTNSTISLNPSGVGNIPSFTATNTTDSVVSATVTVTPLVSSLNTTCFGMDEVFQISVNPIPHILNTSIEICSGENTAISINATVPSTYEWFATPTVNVFNETSFPIQTTSSIQDVLVNTTSVPQLVEYHITPTDIIFGCVNADTIITVTVNPLPTVNFSVLNTSLCDNQVVNFQNNSLVSLNFSWDYGDGNTSFFTNGSNVYDAVGNYNVTLTATNPLTGCENATTLPITISETPNPAFTYSDSAGCSQLEVVFLAAVDNQNWTYNWDFGNGQNAQQVGTAAHQYTQPGCYDVSLTLTSNTGCVAQAIEPNAICVYNDPIAAFSVDTTTVSSLKPTIEFYNESINAVSYVWNFGDGNSSLTEDPIHTYSDEPATYTVLLTASNEIGCIDTAMRRITIFEDILIFVPNSFTPDKNEYNQSFLPILAAGYRKETYHLTIYNRWGDAVFESRDYRFGWDGTLLNGQDCQTGTYTWKISVDVLQTGETKEYYGHVNLIR
jgi:gliding motility-associated-like protein